MWYCVDCSRWMDPTNASAYRQLYVCTKALRHTVVAPIQEVPQ